MEHWHYWIIIGVVCFLIEIFTPGFVVASFGMACLGAAVAAGLGITLNGQLTVFSVLTLIVFVGIRPFAMRYLNHTDTGFATGVNALIGKSGRVTETIDPNTDTGRVQLGGENWKARTESGEAIQAEALVTVESVEGATLIVRSS